MQFFFVSLYFELDQSLLVSGFAIKLEGPNCSDIRNIRFFRSMKVNGNGYVYSKGVLTIDSKWPSDGESEIRAVAGVFKGLFYFIYRDIDLFLYSCVW